MTSKGQCPEEGPDVLPGLFPYPGLVAAAWRATGRAQGPPPQHPQERHRKTERWAESALRRAATSRPGPPEPRCARRACSGPGRLGRRWRTRRTSAGGGRARPCPRPRTPAGPRSARGPAGRAGSGAGPGPEGRGGARRSRASPHPAGGGRPRDARLLAAAQHSPPPALIYADAPAAAAPAPAVLRLAHLGDKAGVCAGRTRGPAPANPLRSTQPPQCRRAGRASAQLWGCVWLSSAARRLDTQASTCPASLCVGWPPGCWGPLQQRS